MKPLMTISPQTTADTAMSSTELESDAPEREDGDPRGHEMRRRQAQERILDAAFRLVASGGFDALTLAEVGAAAGYSRGLPGHYFHTKDALIQALLDHVAERQTAQVRMLARRSGGLEELLRSLETFIALSRERVEPMRAMNAFIGASLGKPEFATAVNRMNDASAELVAERIAEGQRLGEIRKDIDPKVYAHVVVGGMRGLAVQWLGDPAGYPMDAVTAAFIDSVRCTLKA